jgi:hypothetical protein
MPDINRGLGFVVGREFTGQGENIAGQTDRPDDHKTAELDNSFDPALKASHVFFHTRGRSSGDTLARITFLRDRFTESATRVTLTP